MVHEYVLHCDWDWNPSKKWVRIWHQAKTAMLESLGFIVDRIIMKPSDRGRGRGRHIWIHIQSRRKLSEDEVNMLQWLCGDDVTRVRINRFRTRRGMKRFWNKLFDHIIWRKPLPENCKKCHLRAILKEMEAKICPG